MQISHSPSNLAQLLKNIPLKYPSMKRLIFSPKLLLLATLLSLLSSGLYAQNPDIVNGYMITAKGDSLVGQIHVGGLKKNILRFRTSEKSAWTYFNPKEIMRASAPEKDIYILPQEIRNAEDPEQILVQKIVEGGYGLYAGYNAKKNTLYFLQLKENEGLVKLNPFGYVAQLKTLFGACGQQVKEKNLQYNHVRLSRYFKNLNKCAFPDQKTAAIEPKLKPKLGVSLSGFYFNINPKIEQADGYLYGDYRTIKRGGMALMAKLKITPAIGIFTGIQYVNKHMSTDTIFGILGYTKDEPGIPPIKTKNYYRYALDWDAHYIEIPLGFTYNLLPYRRWSPTLTGGIAFPILIKSRFNTDWGYPIGDPFTIPKGEIGHISPTWMEIKHDPFLSFFGGLGLKRRLKNKHEIEIRTEFYNQSEMLSVGINKISPTSQTVNIATNRIQVSLIYTSFFKVKQ